jgi:hypothetical protein
MTVPDQRCDCGRDAFSASGWVDASMRGALGRAVPAILEGARPFRPRCLLLSGSAALGEAVGWEAGDPGDRLVLSDLDLGLVTADRVPGTVRLHIQRAARAAGVPERRTTGENGGEHAAARTDSPPPVEVTVGFYESAWWSRQAPTPGMADARARGIVVWGDATLPGRLVVPLPARIHRWEGVRLVGNRALELLSAPGPLSGPALRPRGWYALAKAAAGLATAQLISQGRYSTGWAARRALLEADLESGNPAGGDVPARLALAWAPFLERPCPATLPAGRAWLSAFREALIAWLGSLSPDRCPPEAALEAAFLGEPASMRERLGAWRAEARRAPGEGRAPAAAGRMGLPAWIPRGAGTPGGRRMAVAVLYWRELPERPEPCWGEIHGNPPDAAAWEETVRRLLGRSVPAGPGCRSRLVETLGLEAASLPGAGEGQDG